MFESDGKKLLRKRGKLAQNGDNLSSGKSMLANAGPSNTVFKELKLSEVLSSELKQVRE